MAQGGVIATSSGGAASALAGTFGGDSQHGYIRVRLKPLAGTIYLGSSGVTTGGYPLTTSDSPLEVNLFSGETLWASSTAAATVAVLRTGETS